MNKFVYAFLVVLLIGMLPIAGSAAAVTPALTYQGKLMDASGNPMTGTYGMIFTLYDVPSGGTPLSIDKHLVTVTNGLFTTTIAITDPPVLDGRALWLGVKVGSDAEMTPRQPLQPVPYALGLRPGVVGASFTTNQAGNLNQFLAGVNVSTLYDFNPGARITTAGLNSRGVHIDTDGDSSTAVYAVTHGDMSESVYAWTNGNYSHGMLAYSNGPNSDGIHVSTYQKNSKGVYARTWGSDSPGVRAETSRANSPAISGESAQDVGISGTGKEGGYFTTNQAGTFSNHLAGVNVSTRYMYNPGIRVNTGGDWSHGVAARTSGSFSPGMYAETAGSNSNGVSALVQGFNSRAIYGSSLQDVGVYGSGKEGAFFTTNQPGTYEITSAGVNVSTRYNYNPGVQIATTGFDSPGVRAVTSGVWSPAISGESAQNVGISGIGKEGAFFTTNQGGTWIDDDKAGVNVSTQYEWNPGIRVNTSGEWSDGVQVFTSGDSSLGVSIETDGWMSEGVRAHTDGWSSTGVTASTTGYGSTGVVVITHNGNSHGISARTNGGSSQGVRAFSNQSYAIYAETGRDDHQYGLATPDYISALGYKTNSGDVAEYMPVTEAASPGMVLIIGEDGRLTPATAAYDTRVAGIVSTDPGIFLGAEEDGNEGEALIAIAGRVPCKVDASYGAINPGDVLTTSPTPGYAMKAEPLELNGRTFYPSGTILGKALGTLESGTGTIEVIVTLQ